MTMPIEQAALLRISEILVAAGHTVITRPPNSSDPADAIVVAAFEPVDADGRSAVWFTMSHSTDGENVDSGTPGVSYAMMDIFLSSPDSMRLVTLAQTLRLSLYTNAKYWPTTGTRRRVRHCRAAAGGAQDRTEEAPILYVERMKASICFDDTPRGVVTD